MIPFRQRLRAWWRARLNRQIIAPTVFVALFFLGLLGVAAFLLGERAVVGQVDARNRQLAVQVSGEVAAFVQSLIDAMRLQEQSLLAPSPSITAGEPVDGAALALTALRKRYSYAFQGLQLLNERGERVLLLPDGTDTVQRFAPPASVALPDSVSEALRTRRITASPVAFRPFDFSPSLTLAVPLSSGETTGLLVAEVDLRILWTKVDGIRIEGGSVSIIDRAGVIVAHPNRRRVGQMLDVAAIAPVFTGHTGVTSYKGNGQSYLAGYSPISGVLRWGVIVEQRRATALAPVRVIAALATLVTLVSALSLALLLLRIVHRAVQPLEALSRTVATIAASGDLSHDLPLTRSDEIGALTDSFNRMLASLRQAQERLQCWNEDLERRVAERTAQLEAANQELQREIAVRRQAEAEINRINRDLIIARDQALEASRAKSAFLARMSHELRTPLNAILGFAQLMARSPAMPPAYQENLQVINRSGEHLLTLINDVLAMSKIEAGQIALNETSFDLHHLLDSLKTMFRLRAASKGLALAFEYSSDLPRYIRTDEDKLRQILVNLLDNAIKFTAEGSVTLRVRSEADKRHLSSREEGEASTPSPPSSHTFALHFEVEDTGVGIPPNEVETLFEAFGLAGNGHARPKGAGLGLPISRRFVQLLGGDLALRSPGVPGQGAIFCFDIPVNPADPAEVQIVQPSRQVIGLAPDQPPYRILIAEDKFENRILLQKQLEAAGFEVRAVANGREAIEVWESWGPHLIWMDTRMPLLDGYQATKQIKSTPQGGATVIIALTASTMEEAATTVLSAGYDDLVRKPFRERDIFDMLAKHLEVHYLYDDQVEVPHDFETPGRGEAEENLKSELQTLSASRALPPGWLADLHRAASQADADLIFDLISHLEAGHAALAQALTELVDAFRFDTIMTLTAAENASDQDEDAAVS